MVQFLLLLMWDYDHGTIPPSLNVLFSTIVVTNSSFYLMWDKTHGTLLPSNKLFITMK